MGIDVSFTERLSNILQLYEPATYADFACLTRVRTNAFVSAGNDTEAARNNAKALEDEILKSSVVLV